MAEGIFSPAIFFVLKPCIFLQAFIRNRDQSQMSVEDNQINDTALPEESKRFH